MIESLRYKLRMFGIPIDNPTYVFCDNQSVITNATVPGSKLKKKHVIKKEQIEHTLTERDILENVKHPFLV